MRTLLIAAVTLFATVAPAAAKPLPRVPANFMGTMIEGPLLHDARVNFDLELDRMATSGVQSVRTVFAWNVAQPYQSFADVPPDQLADFRDESGVPTSYAATDRLVTAAAQRRMSLLPVVITAPAWDARHPYEFNSPPKSANPYAAFMSALVGRYGPSGSFWTEHPELQKQPIRYWQIWNEPSLKQFWSDYPFAKDYVALLRAARVAIKRADPGAKVVLAGLPNQSWVALEQMYKAGLRGLFDIAALHPFTETVAGVRAILERDRGVMARYHDQSKPIWITELSWTSAKGKTKAKYGNEETEAGQATKLSQAFALLAAERRKLKVERVYWYTWLTTDNRSLDYPFDFAGLSRLNGDGSITRKPAFAAFRRIALRLEGCRTKAVSYADRCAG